MEGPEDSSLLGGLSYWSGGQVGRGGEILRVVSLVLQGTSPQDALQGDTFGHKVWPNGQSLKYSIDPLSFKKKKIKNIWEMSSKK